MKTEQVVSLLARIAFGLALAAMLAALLFSILRRTTVAEQAGVVSYVFLVIGACLSFIENLRSV